jgi:hypothetical protein
VALSSLAKLGMSVVLGISSTAGVSTLSTQLENGGPSVSWVTQDGVSVSGVHRLSASAAVAGSGTARISKWCLFQDGVPVIYSSSSGIGWRDARVANSSWVGAGCWVAEFYSATTAYFDFDSTSWANGSRRYSIVVTDSAGRTATSSTITINHSNPQPELGIASFVTNRSGTHSLSLQVNYASSSASLVDLCVLNASSGLVIQVSGQSLNASKCWQPSSGDRRPSKIDLKIDSLSSKSDDHVVEFVAEDNFGRKSVVRHAFQWTPSPFGVEVTGLGADQQVIGRVKIKAVAQVDEALRTKSSITSWCLKVNAGGCMAPTKKAALESSFDVDTTMIQDGNQVITIAVTDSLGRETKKSIPVMIANGLPQIGVPKIIKKSAKGRGITVQVQFGLSRASSGTLRVRRIDQKKSFVIPVTMDASPTQKVLVGGLVAGKAYQFEVTAANVNGRSASAVFEYRAK